MDRALQQIGAASFWGPSMCALGTAALLLGGIVHGVFRRPTIFPRNSSACSRSPGFWERISVHLLVYGVWSVSFGAILWRGTPADMIDVRLALERQWPVVESAEWIYLSAYVVPLAMPWLARTRSALRRYSFKLWTLLAIAVACFLILPFGSPPRPFEPTSIAGKILAWETSRADFAAASFPSFHVFWGLLCAELLATRGRRWAIAAWLWAALVAASCIANGAHALVDVAASLAIYFTLARSRTRSTQT